ncbi:hypothetical protein CANMA_005242 [Candida margitis]|uniref:uncharacterized protein n=1 Tax=Candida margitis TaxID=1775924 RepID=UPI00222688E1|nr:uncharacterized protein CANMA_005242 [Candida margitis]KAI5950582.1 hypothetical protein CANMA_005242 [Candida margitis]
MPIFGDHALTAITIKINQLVEHKNDEVEDAMELYLSDLLSLINVQHQAGATEAARAIRKKIKYGDSIQEQVRALQLLELLVLNSGTKIGPVIARDDKLLDVLKGIINGHGRTGSGTNYSPKVKKTVINMAVGWKSELDGLKGYQYMQGLYKTIPGIKKRSKHSRSASGSVSKGGNEGYNDYDVFDEESDPYGDDHAYDDEGSSRISESPRPSNPRSPKVPPPRPTTASPYSISNRKSSSKKDKLKKKKKRSKNGIVYADSEYGIPQINYKLEAPKIRHVLTECNDYTITLNNQLLQLPPGSAPQDDDEVMTNFQKCKKIRRKILKYLQFVGAGDPSEKSSDVAKQDEEFLAKLIYANEQLVETFKKFDVKAGYSSTNPAPPEVEELSESDESYYSTEDDEDDDDDLEEAVPGEDSIAARLQSVTLENKRPPPPVPQVSRTSGKDKPQSTNGLERPGLAKIETSESLGDPFGDKNTVDKEGSVYY